MALQDSAQRPQTRSHTTRQNAKPNNRLRALRDFSEMISGIFLDLRGDLADSLSELIRPLRNSIRRMKIGRNT